MSLYSVSSTMLRAGDPKSLPELGVRLGNLPANNYNSEVGHGVLMEGVKTAVET